MARLVASKHSVECPLGRFCVIHRHDETCWTEEWDALVNSSAHEHEQQREEDEEREKWLSANAQVGSSYRLGIGVVCPKINRTGCQHDNHGETQVLPPKNISCCIQPGAVKLVLWRHLMHEFQVHPVTPENQFHCTRLYMYVMLYLNCKC